MGMAIVIVNHITIVPIRLHEVLPRDTTMPVELITESLRIQPNRVFIIPSNRDLHVEAGEFQLKPRGWPDMPESAVGSSCLDFVLSPEDIAREIVRIASAEA